LPAGDNRRIICVRLGDSTRASGHSPTLKGCMPLFKYLRPEFADALIVRGSLRIGTLYGFRDEEALDPERGDKLEGVRQYVGPSNFDSARDKAATNYLATKGTVLSGCIFENTAGGPAFMHEEGVPDCYIYCTSATFEEANCAAIGGACVEILDPSFFDVVSDELIKRVLTRTRATVERCIYGDKTEAFTRDRGRKPPGWFVKPAKYEHQMEVRAMWVPTKETSMYGTLRSSFIKYVTLDREDIVVEALIRSPCIRRVR
jgi:hypothetical protein